MRKFTAGIFAAAVLLIAGSQLDVYSDWASSAGNPVLDYNLRKVFVWQWIGLAILFILALAFGQVVVSLARRATRWSNRFTAAPMQTATLESISRSCGLLAGAVFFNLLDDQLFPPVLYGHKVDQTQILHVIDLGVTVLVLFGGVSLIYAWWDVACDSLAARAAGHERAERLLVPMGRKLVRACIIVGGILIAIGVLGGAKTVYGLIGTLGIGGLVIALAAKDSVENLFGSLTIMFDMPFALGDWVKIDKVEGTVEQINLRSTRVRTAEDTVINLPNANLIRASVENFGSRRFRRFKEILRLSYDCQPQSIESFRKAIVEFLEAQPNISPQLIEVSLTDPSEASIGLSIECRLEVDTRVEELEMRHAVLEEALRLRGAHKVMFAAAPRPKDA